MKNISNKYDPFERKIKKALDQFEVPYNPADWAAMDAMLNKKRKKRPILFFPNHTAFTAGVGIAVILVGMLMGWNLYIHNFIPATQQKSLSQQNTSATTTNSHTQATTIAPNVLADKAPNATSKAPNNKLAVNAKSPIIPNNKVYSKKYTSVVASTHNAQKQVLAMALPAKQTHSLDNNTPLLLHAAADKENNKVPTLFNYTEPITAANEVATLNLDQDDNVLKTLAAQNLYEKHAIPAYLPILAEQDIKKTLSKSATEATIATIEAPQMPKNKKRFLAGVQTAFTQTFTNKSTKTNYATAIGLSAEYKLTPHWAAETGIMTSTNVVNFASPIPTVSNDFHSPKITNVESKQIEIPLLIKHYFKPEARTQAYISVGTAFVHQSDVAYNIYVPTQETLDMFTCECNSNLPTTNSETNQIASNNTEKVVQPKLALNNRFDWVQAHGGLQYQLNKNIVLQADASIKTGLRPNSIYDENLKNSIFAESSQQSQYLLSDKYRTTTTGLQFGVLYRF